MTEFYITFGNMYRTEEHPAGRWIHPDGYLVIEATDYSTARECAFGLLGSRFAFMYKERPPAELFPLGSLKRVKTEENKSWLTNKSAPSLMPARTCTSWWHEYATKGDVLFLRGRLKFGNAKNSAPFPSAIVVFGRDWKSIFRKSKDD